jgi:predicted N-acetyltransferase YhbS
MEVIRLLRPEEFPQAIELADQVFRKGRKPSVGTSYPYSFSTALGQSFGVFEDGELVTFLGFVPTLVHVGSAVISAYKIGQVCTAEKARGKGYAGKILEQAIRHAQRSQASLIFVSGDRPLYIRAECHRYGQLEYAQPDSAWADQFTTTHKTSYILREADYHDWFEMHRLAAARQVAFDYSLWDLAALIEAESLASTAKRKHKVMVAERGGQLFGWLVCAVATAEPNQGAAEVIEWAGTYEAVAHLLAGTIRKFALARCVIGIPHFESGLASYLKNAKCTKASYPGTVHVVHPGRLLQQLMPHLAQVLSLAEPSELKADYAEDSQILFRYKHAERRFTSQQWIEFLFGPRERSLKAEDEDLSEWNRAIPVPLPSPNGLGFV